MHRGSLWILTLRAVLLGIYYTDKETAQNNGFMIGKASIIHRIESFLTFTSAQGRKYLYKYNIDTHSFLQSYVCTNQTNGFIITVKFKLLENKLLAILLLIS